MEHNNNNTTNVFQHTPTILQTTTSSAMLTMNILKIYHLQWMTLLMLWCLFGDYYCCCGDGVLAFAFTTQTSPHHIHNSATHHHFLRSSSSSSSESTTTTTTPALILKQELLDLLASTPTNAPTSRDVTQSILSKIQQLEQYCPTPPEEVVSKLAGNWELLWTTQDTTSIEYQQSNPLRTWIK